MQFNYIISHNLRAPIASLLGLAELLKTEISNLEREVVNNYIIKSVEGINDLIIDLNSVIATKIIGNGQMESCDLHQIINKIFSDVNQQINVSLVDVKVRIDEDAAIIQSVKSYIQSLFYNLISNAIKYRSPARKLMLNISVTKIDEKTRIEVSDNGIGIDIEKHKAQLFGLYKRFTKVAEGKGLGLYMTKTQIESLGGSINVESEVDKGTTFTVVI